MNIEHFLKGEAPNWMKGHGTDTDIVLSTRIRLARNLDGYRFPLSFSEQEAEKIEEVVTNALQNLNGGSYRFSRFSMKDMPRIQKQVLVEKHLISPMLAKKNTAASVLISEDESISVMLNEEDHIRIQFLSPGLQLLETYELANKLDCELEKILPFAYNERFGFLTSCPTNVGTGLRASVMMHLPALTMTQQMKMLTQMLTRLGMVVRGIYGEGSENLGNIYQISNQITLGKTEEEILNEMQNVVVQIIQNERAAREQLLQKAPVSLEDKCNRALGTLKYARLLSSEEAATCLSNVRLGVDLGVIKNVPLSVINECMILIQPGFVQQYAGTTLQATERDIYRAKLLREKLSDQNLKFQDKGEEKNDV